MTSQIIVGLTPELIAKYQRISPKLTITIKLIASPVEEPCFPAKQSVRAKWERIATYDQTQDLEQIQMSVLVVLGGRNRPALAHSVREPQSRS
jgi:hypothetical protein